MLGSEDDATSTSDQSALTDATGSITSAAATDEE